MKFAHRIAHLLFPRESNNHRAKILHPTSLTILTFVFILYQLFINVLPKFGVHILGYASNIPPSEVIRLTNEKRAQAGLPALTENGTLSAAAQAKGADMLNRDYWAHVAPDGTEPWSFFINAGYKYRYAGENLARDFSNASSAVDAWMGSSTHKENILSPKYKEIGIAVIEGDLAGVDTTIIVQFFGTKYTDVLPTVPEAQAQTQGVAVTQPTPSPRVVASVKPTSTPIPSPTVVPTAVAQAETGVQLSPFNMTKKVSIIFIGFILLILIIDGVVVYKKGIARVGGRSFAHIAFLIMILIMAIILKVGQIR
jgi:hypothetical protein